MMTVLLEKWLLPDLLLPDYLAVTAELLHSLGKRGLICDIDNTLATYDDAEMPPAVDAWWRRMQAAGIGVAFVSNNHEERVSRFAGGREISVFPNSGKPSCRGLRAAMAAMGTSSEETAVLGDQLLTDVLSAKRAGLYAMVVPPIKDRTGWFFRFKRKVEKPYLRRYAALHAEKDKEESGS